MFSSISSESDINVFGSTFDMIDSGSIENSISIKIGSPTRPSVGILLDFGSDSQRNINNSLSTSDLCNFCFNKIMQVAQTDSLEYGIRSRTDDLIELLAKEHPAQIGAILQEIGLRFWDNANLFLLLLKAMGELDYMVIAPYGEMLALAAISNSDIEVKEAGVRLFEKWEHLDGVRILGAVKTQIPWLDSYIGRVIENLENLK